MIQDGVAAQAISKGYSSCAGVVQLKEDDPDVYKDKKACNALIRIRAFARRVRDLAQKQADDGSRYVPDVITLQETFSSDTDLFRTELKKHTGYDFGLAAHTQQFDDGGVHGGAAILYNRNTMEARAKSFIDMVDPGKIEETYRTVTGLLVERPLVPNGPYTVAAVASTHMVPGKKSVDAGRRSEIRQAKADWFQQIASQMDASWPSAARSFIAGDFNEPRCLVSVGPDEREEGYPADSDLDGGLMGATPEPVDCARRPLHTRANGLAFVDAVHQVHGKSQITMNRQYEDGFGTRELRIDHVFVRGGSILSASHDRTCGTGYVADPLDPTESQTCDYLSNPDRYSDHRLVWALVGPGVQS